MAERNNLGIALLQTNRPLEAITEFERALALKPDFADAHNNLGVVLAEQGHVAEAILHYEEALRLKRDYVDAHYNYGNALNQSGRTAEAMTGSTCSAITGLAIREATAWHSAAISASATPKPTWPWFASHAWFSSL